MSLKKTAAAALCCVAVMSAGISEAKSVIVKNLPLPVFPGVEFDATLSGDTFLGTLNAKLNLKTKVLTATGRAAVQNLAFVRVTFVNQGIFPIGGLLSEKYVVAANGRATYNGKFFVGP